MKRKVRRQGAGIVRTAWSAGQTGRDTQSPEKLKRLQRRKQETLKVLHAVPLGQAPALHCSVLTKSIVLRRGGHTQVQRDSSRHLLLTPRKHHRREENTERAGGHRSTQSWTDSSVKNSK